MDDIRFQYRAPIVTGTPGIAAQVPPHKPAGAEPAVSFQSMLQDKLSQNSNVAFSKHAVKRALEHNIELSDDSLARLNEGVRIASEKNLGDTLILVDQSAFLVNVKNNTVITAVQNGEAKGNVFTNINGAVIV